MNNNKETERADLHKIIWRIANDLRGSVDGWDFKTYVLGMLFYRFISESLTAYLNVQERKAGNQEFDYATLSDADAEFGRPHAVALHFTHCDQLVGGGTCTRRCAPMLGAQKKDQPENRAGVY